MSGLPSGLLLAYYGDDFTGSTDVLLTFASAGIECVLFLRLPTRDDLARFPKARVIGLAGTSRAQSPQWMDAHLPEVFRALHALGAPILQYKICSTFDSSPTVGSIGRAIDLGVQVVGGTWSPMIVGAPMLKRYQVFGHLFAKAHDIGYRLDRHPTMSQHPVTPMDESDLAIHLARQTSRRIALVDFTALAEGAEHVARARAAGDCPIVLLDVLDEVSLQRAGALVWSERGQGIFSASSSGLPAALVAHWRAQGWWPQTSPRVPTAPFREQILVVSGSCSPITAQQITWAQHNGFACVGLDVPALLDSVTAEGERQRVLSAADAAWQLGKSVVIFSAHGPSDPVVQQFEQIAAMNRLSVRDAAQQIGLTLGQLTRTLITSRRIARLIVAGGDSSGAITSALQADALTLAADLAPGAPLCRVTATDPHIDGMEVCLKGGQMGGVDFFGVARGQKYVG